MRPTPSPAEPSAGHRVMPTPASDAITVPLPTRPYKFPPLSSVRTGEYRGDVARGSLANCPSDHLDTVAPAATATPQGKEYPSPVGVWGKSGREKSGQGKSDDCDSVSPMAMTILLDDSLTGSYPPSSSSSTVGRRATTKSAAAGLFARLERAQRLAVVAAGKKTTPFVNWSKLPALGSDPNKQQKCTECNRLAIPCQFSDNVRCIKNLQCDHCIQSDSACRFHPPFSASLPVVLPKTCMECQSAHQGCHIGPSPDKCSRCHRHKLQCVFVPSRQGARTDLTKHGSSRKFR